ncbi:MAG: class I SAM-dependent methyltransferase [Bacteroidetes bacterium]|nr:class I SAM-dependent methyltransferase [Bacteroidota bacterium]
MALNKEMTPTAPTPDASVLNAILAERDGFLRNAGRLRQADPNDPYWQDLATPEKYTRGGQFLETGMLISWLGRTRKPKRILEIGTRTGGSLISLLHGYSAAEQAAVQEVLSFDMWREYVSTTPFASFVSKLLGKDRNINVSERFTGLIRGSITNMATRKVQDNLRLFGIATDRITFISGDSKTTVPGFFKDHPQRLFDYILVDGGHDVGTAHQDLENVVGHCDVGGVIVFDDIAPESYGLLPVWERFQEAHRDEFDFQVIMHRKGMAWAVRKQFRKQP